MVLARRLLLVCVFMALLVCGWYFAANNSSVVTVNHPGGAVGEFKLWIALSGSFALGVLISVLISMYRGARFRISALSGLPDLDLETPEPPGSRSVRPTSTPAPSTRRSY